MSDGAVTVVHAAGPARVWPHLNPVAMVRDLWRHRDLIAQFTRREIEGRYKGSYLGLLWSFLTPLAMLAVFTFVFGVVFQARWPHARGGDTLAEFALVMFSGQLAFQLFSEPVSRAAGLIVAVPNFVKKVVFPLEILPVAAVGAALFHALVAAMALALVTACMHGGLPWTVVVLPIAILPMVLLSLGATWFVSGLGVYLRDIGFLVGVVLQVLFFATPIFYPVEAVPEGFRPWLALNPLAPAVDLMRGSLVLGTMPAWPTWVCALGLGSLAALLGHAWFRVVRKGFADVL